MKDLDFVCDFIECAIHNILYVRNVYPAEFFEKKQAYNIAIMMSKHPQLNDYIITTISSVYSHLSNNTVSCLHLTIFDSDTHSPLERFIFDYTRLSEELFNVSQSEEKYFETAFRGAIAKILLCDAHLEPAPVNKSYFQLSVEFADDDFEPQFTESEPWIEVESREYLIEPGNIVPIRSLDLGPTKLQIYVQEKEKK